MVKNKNIVLFTLFLAAFLLELAFEFNTYLMIILLIAAFGYVWYTSEAQMSNQTKRENLELMNQVKVNSSDVHLKNKQLLTIVSSIPFPLLLLDEKGKIVIHNVHAAQLRSCEDKIELDAMHNDFHPKLQEIIKDAYILEKRSEQIIQIDEVEYQTYIVPITSHGRFSGCLILLQDITKALSGEKMQKRFIADASHELKTPISVIKGMIEILNRDDFDDAETADDFHKQIDYEVNRLDRIVKDLIEISKLSIEKPILKRIRIDFHDLIIMTCKPLESLAENKNLQLVYDLQGDSNLFCDSQKMIQVINNLVINAIKYSDQGQILIKTYQDDDSYYFQVIDQGCGFEIDEEKKIFDRFYRVNESRSRLKGGSGLGLAIVKSIIDAHDGTIEVQSKRFVGSTFTVRLNRL